MADVVELEQRAAEYGDALDKPPSADDLIEGLLGELRVSMDEASQFCDPEWIYENLVIKGHVIVIPAEPNGGKTTVMWGLCPVMVQSGYDVTYVNADISGSDAKSMVAEAEEKNINLLLPDMGRALGMEHVVRQLAKMAQSGIRFDDKVFIFDTLKKMIPPNDKGATRWLFKVLRQLSAQGMTIILLAHTLKRYTDQGLPEYEGVADIRADVDELIYFVPQEKPDGTKIVSTIPDKVRGQFEPISFRINPDRSVTPLQRHVNLKAAKAYERQYQKDRENIELVHDVLGAGRLNQMQISKATGISKNACIKILKRYKGKQWDVHVGLKNAQEYLSLPPGKRWPNEEWETE